MNILDYKRKALGYMLREGGDQFNDTAPPPSTLGTYQGDDASRYPVVAPPVVVAPPPSVAPPTVAPSSPTVAAGVAKNGPSAGQQLAAVIGRTGGGGPNVDTPVTEYIEGYESVNPDGTINRYDTQGNFVTTYTSNGSDIVGDFFAGIDSSLGLSKGLTAIGGGLADLDSALGLSKNAPAIVGLAASYFLPGIGQALGQSLVNAGVLTGAAATPAMATTIGTALAQTGVSVAQGKSLDEALTNAIISVGTAGLTQAFGADVKSAIGQITSNPIAQNAIYKAGTDVVTAVAQGKTGEQVLQGIGNSLVASVAGDAANELVKNIPGVNNLPDAAKKVVTAGIATKIQGGDGTKSMLDAALKESTNYVLDTLTATPIAPGTAGTTGAMQGGFGSGVTADTVAGGATLDDIEATLAANGLQNTGDQTAPVVGGNVVGTALPSISGANVTSITGGSGGAGSNYYAGQTGPTQPAANTGYDAYMAALQGGYNPFAERELSDGGGDDGINYVTPITGGAADASTGTNYVTPITGGAADASTGTDIESTLVANGLTKPGETSMAQTASQTGGTDTSNADEWGDLQGAIDAATTRGINAKAPTFSEAFSSWRTALGNNKEFPWTNPQTGETRLYTTALAPSESEKAAQAIADQKRIDLMPVYGSAQNTRTGTPLGVSNVFINTKTGDVVEDTRVWDNAGNVVSGSLNLADEGTTTAAINTAVGSTIRTGLDILAGIPRGMGALAENAGTLAGLTGLVDMNNIATRTGASAKAAVDAMRSTDFKDDAKLINDAIAKAGNEGFFAQLIETGKQFGASPTQMAAFIVEQSPTLLVGGGGMAAAKALGAGMTTANAAAIGLNAATQGASVAQDAYADAIKAGKSPEQALNASRLAGSLAALTSVVANKFIPGALSNEGMVAAQTAAKTSIKNALIGEMSSEVAEEASGTIIGNVIGGRNWDSNLGATVAQSLMGSGITTGLMHGVYNSLDAAGVPASERDAEANKIVNQAVVTPTEAREIARELGYTNPSQQVLDSFVGPKSEADARSELDTFLESMSSFEAGKPVNAAAAQEMMADLGLTNMSDADAISLANQIVKSVPQDRFTTEADDFLDRTGVTTEAPPVITSAEVSKIVTAALEANPSLTGEQVSEIVNDAVKNIPIGTTTEDVQKIVADAVKTIPAGLSTENVKSVVEQSIKNLATQQNITDAIADIKFPAGISKTDVADSIATYMKDNPGLSITDVASKITDATKGLVTSEGMKTAISDGLKGVATTKDVETAIANIKFPVGISKEDVSAEIKTYMEDNPGLSAKDVADSISAYMTKNPGLSSKDVETIVSTATKDLATKEGVGTAISAATKDLATTKNVTDLKGDLTKAIDDAGKNNANAFDAIDKVIADLKAAGLTEQQVQDVVDLSVGGATKTLQDAIDAAVTGNTKALGDLQDQVAKDIGASETKVADAISDAEKRLSDAVQAAQDLGLKGDEALQAGLDSVAADLGKSKEEVLTQLGKTEENLKTQFATDIGTVQKSVTDLEKTLVDSIAANEKAGLTRDEATQKALDDVATQMGTDKADVLKQLGTTETDLTKKVTDLEATLGKKIEGTEKALATKLDDQGKAFMKALTDQGIDQQTALDLAIAAQTKLVTEGQETTQKALGELSTAQQQEVADRVAAGEATDAAIAAVKATVETGQEATQKALGELSEAQQKEVADRVKAGEATDAAIAAVQTAVTTGQKATEAKLDAQGKAFMDALVAQGMSQQQALETAIAAQTKLVTEGQNATNLRIDELVKQGMTYQQATQKAITEMSTGFTTQLTGAEKARQEQASAWEAQRKLDLTEAEKQRGVDRQAELDRAAAAETARQTEITNQKAREAANLKKIQTGQLRGQMQTGLQGLIGGLQQQATQMAAPGVVETVKSTPGFDFGSPLNVGFFGGYESQKTPPKDKESLKIATGGYLDDLLEAIR
jgi:hypothetical protein